MQYCAAPKDDAARKASQAADRAEAILEDATVVARNAARRLEAATAALPPGAVLGPDGQVVLPPPAPQPGATADTDSAGSAATADSPGKTAGTTGTDARTDQAGTGAGRDQVRTDAGTKQAGTGDDR